MMPRPLALDTRAKLVSDEEAASLARKRWTAKAKMPIGTFLSDGFAQRLPNAPRRPIAGYAR